MSAAVSADATREALRRDVSSHYSSCHRAFVAIDIHRTGTIEFDELTRILEIYNLPLDHAIAIFAEMDRDKTGVVSYADFAAEFFGIHGDGHGDGHVPDDADVDVTEAMASIDAVKNRDATISHHDGTVPLQQHLQQHYASATKAFLKV